MQPGVPPVTCTHAARQLHVHAYLRARRAALTSCGVPVPLRGTQTYTWSPDDEDGEMDAASVQRVLAVYL